MTKGESDSSFIESQSTYEISKVQVIVDQEGRIIAIKVQQPAQSWLEITTAALEAFRLLCQGFKPRPNLHKDKRSRMQEPHMCPTVRIGVSFGGGQTVRFIYSDK